MVKGPYSHGKTPDEVAREIRVHLTRIYRRRERFRSAQYKGLQEARKRVVEAVLAGVSHKDASMTTGYSEKTVTRWLSKGRSHAREVPLQKALAQLDRVRASRIHAVSVESRTSATARGLVRRAMEAGVGAEEFAIKTGYTAKTVDRWFASVRHVLEQSQRQREIMSVRQGKRSRPPQYLSPVEYDQWLAQEERRRRRVFRKHNLQARRRLNARRTSSAALASPAPQLPAKASIRRPRGGRKRRKK